MMRDVLWKMLLTGWILVLPAFPIQPGDELLLRVVLLRSEAGESAPEKVEVSTSATCPEIASLRAAVPGSLAAWASAANEWLLNLHALDAIDTLFFIEKPWRGSRSAKWSDLIGGEKSFYKLGLSSKRLVDGRISLHLEISSGKTRAAPDALFDQDILLAGNEPSILAMRRDGQAYFAVVLAKDAPAKREEAPAETPPKLTIVPAPPAVRLVRPSYPEALRKRGIGGVVRLIIQIDKAGRVTAVGLDQSAHPYLDYTAIQAMLQSTFEPVTLGGKPAAARFVLAYRFEPLSYRPDPRPESPWPEAGAPSPAALDQVLARSGLYCRRLSDAVMDFVCEEKIRDTHFSLRNSLKVENDVVMLETDREIRTLAINPRLVIDPSKTKRTTYVCDYQVVRKEGALNERRILLQENRQAFHDPAKLLEDRRFALLSPLFAPLRILLPEKQADFFFRIRKEDAIRGRDVYVLEASPKSGDEDGIWSARIWIDKERYTVLQCEIEGIPIEGYEDILADCAQLNIRPRFTTTHEYRLEKEGILFPWRSRVRVAYPDVSPELSIPKNDIVFSYDQYRFFTVSSEHQIIR
jgi:TonB family protein